MKKKAYIQPELSIVTIQGGALLISASVDNAIVLTEDDPESADDGLSRGGFFDDNDNQSDQDWW